MNLDVADLKFRGVEMETLLQVGIFSIGSCEVFCNSQEHSLRMI